MKYACCFCGQNIPREDRTAVQLTLSNLWRPTDAMQGLHAHTACAKNAFTAAPFDGLGLAD